MQIVYCLSTCATVWAGYSNTPTANVPASSSRLVQDAVIRNLQTLAESSQRLSSEIKSTQPQIP